MNSMLGRFYLELTGVSSLLVDPSKAWLDIHDCTTNGHEPLLPDHAPVPTPSSNKSFVGVMAQILGAVFQISSPTTTAGACSYTDSAGRALSDLFWTGERSHLVQGDACAPFRRHTA